MSHGLWLSALSRSATRFMLAVARSLNWGHSLYACHRQQQDCTGIWYVWYAERNIDLVVLTTSERGQTRCVSKGQVGWLLSWLVCWMLNVPTTCWCISGTDLLNVPTTCWCMSVTDLLNVPTTCWCISGTDLLNVPATGWCISGTDLLGQLFVLPH